MAYIAIVCCADQNEQVSEERDSEYEALDERLQAIYSRYFLPLVNAYMKPMKKDGRKLSHQVREKIRIHTVLRIREREKEVVKARNRGEVLKKTLGQIAEECGLHRSCIYNWMARYREGGMEELRTRNRKIPGRPPALKKSQLNKLYNIITTKSPLQFQFESALWTRSIVQEMVLKEFAVTLSEVSTGRLLKNLGVSPTKPVFRTQNHKKGSGWKWLIEEYPAIRTNARSKGAKIYGANKLTIRRATRVRLSLNLISAINSKGKEHFMVIEGAFTDDKFIDFVKNLVHDINGPIFLIAGNHRIYKSTKVRKFIASTEGKLSLFHLP